MSLPPQPIIDPAWLCPCERPYSGAIAPGDVFAWEPDLPHARTLCVVTRVGESWIWTRPIEGDENARNSIGRFREAVVPTMLNPMPVERTSPPRLLSLRKDEPKA